MSWSFSDEIEDRAWRATQRNACPCRGLGYVPIRGAGNPMACEPCGCDEPDDDVPPCNNCGGTGLISLGNGQYEDCHCAD